MSDETPLFDVAAIPKRPRLSIAYRRKHRHLVDHGDPRRQHGPTKEIVDRYATSTQGGLILVLSCGHEVVVPHKKRHLTKQHARCLQCFVEGPPKKETE